jgi:Ca-activated chloride channel homolog
MRVLAVLAVLAVVFAGPASAGPSKKKKRKQAAVVVVVDRSGSMQGPKLAKALVATRAAAAVLRGTDEFAVVAFDSEARVALPLTAAKEGKAIDAALATIKAGGGTDLHPALARAFEALASTAAPVKHVLVLSDGEFPTDGVTDLVDDMRAQGITLSAVAVDGADKAMLGQLAERGDGMLYDVTDRLDDLTAVFVREIKRATK